MNKVILLSFLVACSVAAIEGNVLKNFADDSVYAAIHAILKNDSPNEPEKNQCIVDDLRHNKVADKFYTADLLFNTDKLRKEVQPYADSANLKCEVFVFFQSPIGIGVLVALFILALAIICCLIRCICC